MKILNRVGAWLAYHPKVAAGVSLFSYPIVVVVENAWYFFSELWGEVKSLRDDVDFFGDLKKIYKAWPGHTFEVCAEIRDEFTVKGERK